MAAPGLDVLDARAKTRKPSGSPFALGTTIVYDRRAAVARRGKNKPFWGEGAGKDDAWAGWSLYDGWPRDALLLAPDDPVSVALAEFDPGPHINKAVLTWPQEGSGVIVGLIKKQVGESTSGGTSHGMDGEDFEPGYFTPLGADQWLYAVRHRLDGLDFILVPVDAVRLP